MKHYLFSYGTLQFKRVQIETYGRLLKGKKAILKGYKLGLIEIKNTSVIQKSGKKFHPIAIKSNNPNNKIEGMLFEITEKELLKTDTYEVDDYKRVSEDFDLGIKAWIYVKK